MSNQDDSTNSSNDYFTWWAKEKIARHNDQEALRAEIKSLEQKMVLLQQAHDRHIANVVKFWLKRVAEVRGGIPSSHKAKTAVDPKP